MANDLYMPQGAFSASIELSKSVIKKSDATQGADRGTLDVSQAMPAILISGSEVDTASIAGDLVTMRKIQAVIQTFSEASRATGGHVQVLPEYHFCPVLIGSDRDAISLAEMVEAIDEFVDYEALCNEYPTLSGAQINGAISFLRKLSQTNSRQIDLDALEDEQIAGDVQLIEMLKQAIADKEIVRVLGNNQ